MFFVKSLVMQAEEGKRGLRASEIARLTQEKAAQIHVDDVVDGVVSHCTDFGAFVRIGDEKELTSVEVNIFTFVILLIILVVIS